jgi:hypothetical protein
MGLDTATPAQRKAQKNISYKPPKYTPNPLNLKEK